MWRSPGRDSIQRDCVVTASSWRLNLELVAPSPLPARGVAVRSGTHTRPRFTAVQHGRHRTLPLLSKCYASCARSQTSTPTQTQSAISSYAGSVTDISQRDIVIPAASAGMTVV